MERFESIVRVEIESINEYAVLKGMRVFQRKPETVPPQNCQRINASRKEKPGSRPLPGRRIFKPAARLNADELSAWIIPVAQQCHDGCQAFCQFWADLCLDTDPLFARAHCRQNAGHQKCMGITR